MRQQIRLEDNDFHMIIHRESMVFNLLFLIVPSFKMGVRKKISQVVAQQVTQH